MKFGSVCSGIEAASVAWHPLGWQASWFAEIEPFPCALLAHHYPEVPNHGDMSLLPALVALGEVDAPDILCGGTPCQAFSVAGLRRSLDDARGNLSLIFTQLANAIDERRTADGQPACIVFWENVPGVLNTKDNAFGCFLAGLAGEDEPLQPAGDRWTDCGVVLGPARAVAWRVLDAQYFGLAQRRKRVFVVASARDDFDPAAVLLEFDGVRRDSAPSREAGQKPAPTIAGCANGGGANGPGRDVDSVETLQVITMAHGQGGAEISFDRGPTLTCNHEAPILAHVPDVHPTLVGRSSRGSSQNASGPTLMQAMQVRRLTPRECERLQGFPDDYTLVPYRNKPAADGPRYKALGNSWAVPVVRWIGQRIDTLCSLV